ncbi:hypothetical protein [uncultured Kiloniella sp.]|uniref:hypothetical protein n=1 Tax=uncultured Kiloniella sp. TaxID=1133091 RepID=UPI002602657E|nr:hypothetical protein [uncultured Kiloniella sp.]
MTKEKKSGSLYRDFFYPPFSVMDARAGWWQSRKKEWIEIGLRSEEGRKPTIPSLESIYKIKAGQAKQSVHGDTMPSWATTSIFDPVLCEILYRWFCPKGGHILDPFAGGSVRGIVASKLGHRYTGFDIRQEQIDENKEQIKSVLSKPDPVPDWRLVDACTKSLYKHFKGDVDLLLTCPPYGDLEVYSDLNEDISTLPFDTFAGALKHSIKQASKRLKENRFAVYVVSDIRDKEGNYLCLPDIVRSAGIEAGLKVHGEIVLLNALGTLPLRVRGSFTKSRRFGRAHQNVIVFVKGDPRAANEAIGAVECNDPL